MPGGDKGPVDFVGYGAGLSSPPAPVGGFGGLLDFLGYRVGVPPAPGPAGGFVGLVDFTGFSVGLATGEPYLAGEPPPARGGGEGGMRTWISRFPPSSTFREAEHQKYREGKRGKR